MLANHWGTGRLRVGFPAFLRLAHDGQKLRAQIYGDATDGNSIKGIARFGLLQVLLGKSGQAAEILG